MYFIKPAITEIIKLAGHYLGGDLCSKLLIRIMLINFNIFAASGKHPHSDVGKCQSIRDTYSQTDKFKSMWPRSGWLWGINF